MISYQFEAVPIKVLCERLYMKNADNLKAKIPDKFRIQIGRSVRYDLHAVVDYFRTGENNHENLVKNLLN